MARDTLAAQIRISIVVATGALAAGYVLSGMPIGAGVVIGYGALWLVGRQRAWRWPGLVGLIGFSGAAAFGVWRAAPAVWMLAGTLATLAAWDLDLFSQRLRSAGRVEAEDQLVQAHLRRVWTVTGLGLVLGIIALSIQVEFSLAWALLLAVIAAVGLSRAISFLRRESD